MSYREYDYLVIDSFGNDHNMEALLNKAAERGFRLVPLLFHKGGDAQFIMEREYDGIVTAAEREKQEVEHEFQGAGHDCLLCGEGRQHYIHRDIWEEGDDA